MDLAGKRSNQDLFKQHFSDQGKSVVKKEGYTKKGEEKEEEEIENVEIRSVTTEMSRQTKLMGHQR